MRILLISEFARTAGVRPDTVRYYVRLGLLRPRTGAKGGRNAYQVFDERDVKAIKLVRLSQAAGLSLREIEALSRERRAGRLTSRRRIEVVSAQIGKLDSKAAVLTAMADYLRAKRDWLAGGEQGAEPEPGFGETGGWSDCETG